MLTSPLPSLQSLDLALLLATVGSDSLKVIFGGDLAGIHLGASTRLMQFVSFLLETYVPPENSKMLELEGTTKTTWVLILFFLIDEGAESLKGYVTFSDQHHHHHHHLAALYKVISPPLFPCIPPMFLILQVGRLQLRETKQLVQCDTASES